MPLTKPSYAHQATLVFTGTVTGVDVHSSPPVYSSIDPVDVTFDVETVYKGAVTRTFQVVTVAGDASCGYRFIVGVATRSFRGMSMKSSTPACAPARSRARSTQPSTCSHQGTSQAPIRR